MILSLVDEAVASGARLFIVCQQLAITARALQRWRKQGPEGGEDRRRGPRTTPKNKLPDPERTHLLEVLNSEPYRDLSPKQIVALRFASDAGLGDLLSRAVREQITPRAIKSAVKQWRPDYLRT
jgi:transposase-like protein